MYTESYRFSDEDLQYISDALGRRPVGVIGVAARNDLLQPTVIINLPMNHDGQRWNPFPTLYWLVDPALSTQLSELERRGAIGELEQALQDDETLMQQHLADNRDYARSRWAVLNNQEQAAARQMNVTEVLEYSGIGGVANHATLKCLHAQVAYHLAKHEAGSTVGKLIKRMYPGRVEL